MLTIRNFDDVVATVRGATKSNKENVFHTWDGWISRGVLHIVSRSGAATQSIWYFGVGEHRGKRLMFKNTAGEAYVYARPGARNALEEALLAMNEHCQFEQVGKIVDQQFYSGGWNMPPIVSDGIVTRLNENSTSWARVEGGSYVIHFDDHYGNAPLRPVRVVYTPGADLAHVAKVAAAELLTRRFRQYNATWDNDEVQRELHTLARDTAEGYPYPDAIRERLWDAAREYNRWLFEEEGLEEGLRYWLPEQVAYRATVEEVIAQIKRDFRLYQDEGCDDVAVFLPAGEIPDWDSLLGWDGKVSRWSYNSGYRDGALRLPESPVMKAVDEWPTWIEERIREECARWPSDAKRVPENLQLADDPAIVAIKPTYRDSSRYGQVMIVNGRDPNVGFGRVQWNRFWDQRAA